MIAWRPNHGDSPFLSHQAKTVSHMATKIKPHRPGLYADSLILSPIRHLLSPWHPTQSSADGARSVQLLDSVLKTGWGALHHPLPGLCPSVGAPGWAGRPQRRTLNLSPWGRGRAGPAGRVGRQAGVSVLGSAGSKGQEHWLGVCCHGSCRPRAPPPRQWLAFPRRLCLPQSFPVEALLLKTRGGEGSRCPLAHPWKLQKSNLGWGGGR